MDYDYARFRVNEAVRPSLSPVLRGLGQTSGGPRYFDINGNTITQIECGKPYFFEVPGYTSIILRVTKNGQETFNGPFTVPMPAYTSLCSFDVGQYEATATDPATGQVIGKAILTITSGASIFSSLSPTTWLLIGGVALFMLRKKRA